MCREVNEEVLEFECHLKIDVHFLNEKGIPYKYCVYGVDHAADEYEYFHSTPYTGWREIWNRCLRVNYRPSEKSKNYMVREISVTLELT